MLDGAISGLITGSAYAILAVCVVVLYRLAGIVNIGLAAIGALGAYTSYALGGLGSPWFLAVLIGLITAGAVSGASGWVVGRWLSTPSVTTRTIVSVVLLLVITALGFRLFGDSPRVMPSLVPDWSIRLGGVNISASTIAALTVTAVLAVGLALLQRRTQIGLRMVAMSEDPLTVQLMGVNAQRLTIGVWAASGCLATIALLLVGPTHNPTFQSMSFLIVPALAAALLSGFTNAWIAAIGGLMIGMLEGVGARIAWLSDYRNAIPYAVIIIALIWLRRGMVWNEVR